MPFLVLLGYSLFDNRFSDMVLIIPYFSVLGVFPLFSIFMRYRLNGMYCDYLVNRINEALGEEVILGEKLARMYYSQGFTLVTAAVVLVLGVLLLANPLLVPTINVHVISTRVQRSAPFPVSQTEYWLGVCLLALYVWLSVLHQFDTKSRECSKYIKEVERRVFLPDTQHPNVKHPIIV